MDNSSGAEQSRYALSEADDHAAELSGQTLRRQLALDYGDQPIAALGRLETRAANVAARLHLATIGQLVDQLDTDPKEGVATFGRRTYAALVGHLDQFARLGPTRFIFGRETVPGSASELFEAYLARLESPRDREFIRLRYAEGLTLQAVADAAAKPLTRERVRQVVEENQRLDRPVWGRAAADILAPLEALLECSGGLAPLAHCLHLAGATGLGQLEFAIGLASRSPELTVVRAGEATVVSLMTVDDVHQLRSLLRDEVDEALARQPSLAAARAVLQAHGIRLPGNVELDLLRDLLLVDVNGESASPARRSTQAIWVEALRLAGKPVSAEEVARRVAASHPEEASSARNAAAHFGRSPAVFNLGRNRWAHIDNLGVELAVLDRVAEACFDAMPLRERASNVGHLLKKVAEQLVVPAQVSPYAVRDVMIKTGKVRGWRNSLDVAWTELDGSHRLTIAERIRRSAAALDQPFLLAELIAEVASLGGTNLASVATQVQSAVDLLSLGGGEYVVRSTLFPEAAQFATEQARLAALIPAGRVVTSAELANLAKSGAPASGLYDDPRYAWGIARDHSSLTSRLRGLVLWRAADAGSMWQAFAQEPTFDLPPTFRVSDLRGWLRRVHGFQDDVFAYQLISEAVAEGEVQRQADGSYARASAPTAKH